LFANGLTVNPSAHLFSLVIAANDLRKTGDIKSMEKALRRIPSEFNPGGAVTTVAVRLALMQRDYDRAAQILADSGLEELNDSGIGGLAAAIDGYTYPKSWYEGIIAQGMGNREAAHQAFEAARKSIEDDARVCASDEKSRCLLGLIHAGLGNKDQALAEARRATEILPVTTDAFDGPILATNLAVVYTQTGELDEAVAELEKVINLPNGPTPALLRVEPQWDPLRGHRGFQALTG
jgi:tetratricopeptide (TPR) repeat protein